jgi:hypothetical protein
MDGCGHACVKCSTELINLIAEGHAHVECSLGLTDQPHCSRPTSALLIGNDIVTVHEILRKRLKWFADDAHFPSHNGQPTDTVMYTSSMHSASHTTADTHTHSA